MTAQPPRSYTRLAIAIVIAALIVGSSAFLITSTMGRTTTVTLFAGTTLGTTTACSVVGPNVAVLVQVADANGPIAGANMTVLVISKCGSSEPVVAHSYAATANSTGWVRVCGDDSGICALTISAFGYDYPLSVPLQPGVLSEVRFDLSSGNVTVTYCSSSQTCS